jgi:hypothetical protein
MKRGNAPTDRSVGARLFDSAQSIAPSESAPRFFVSGRPDEKDFPPIPRVGKCNSETRFFSPSPLRALK